MPTYEFRCPQGHDFEKLYRTISGAEAAAACPTCGETSGRIMSAAGFAFKGSGFYLTDYGRDAHRTKGALESQADGSKADGATADAGKADAGKTDGAKSDSPKSETAKADGAKSEAPAVAKSDPPAGGAAKRAESKPAETKPAPAAPKPSSGE